MSFQRHQIGRHVVNVFVRVDRQQLLCASSGSRISTFGTSPSRVNERCVPSAVVSMTMKSSMRSSRPSTFCSGRRRHRHRDRASGPPLPAAATASAAAARPSGSAAPSAPRFASRCPADRPSASGTSCTSPRSTPVPPSHRRPGCSARRSAPGGGDALPLASSPRRLWMYSAIAFTSSGGSGSGGITGMPGFMPPVLDDRQDQLAVLIVEHELRAEQVRTADVAAAQIGAVAGAAVDAVEPLPRAITAGSPGGALLRGKRRPGRGRRLAAAAPAPRRARRDRRWRGWWRPGARAAPPCSPGRTASDPSRTKAAGARSVFGRINHLNDRSTKVRLAESYLCFRKRLHSSCQLSAVRERNKLETSRSHKNLLRADS